MNHWFTDPTYGKFTGKEFSSYYQYDPQTRNFVRIRLQLERGSGRGDTKAMYYEDRYVGFSKEKMRGKKNFKAENGKIVFKGEQLSTTPTNGDRAYDMIPGTKPHYGTQVTKDPNLPEGIELEHLKLIANDVMLKGQDVIFTGKSATPEKLSEELKTKVSKIMDNKPFDEITKENIKAKLQSQEKEYTVRNSKASIERSTEKLENDFDQMNSEIKMKLEDGFIPNKDFENAYAELKQAVSDAKSAIENDDAEKAHEHLLKAKSSMEEAIKCADQDELSTVKESLKNSVETLDTAVNESKNWHDNIQVEEEAHVEM